MEQIRAVFFELRGILLSEEDTLSVLGAIHSKDKKETPTRSPEKRIFLPEKVSIAELETEFFKRVELIHGLGTTLEALARRGMVSVLFTPDPVEVVEWFLARFPFDHGIGGFSLGSPVDGGDETHWGTQKLYPEERIREFLVKKGLRKEQCLAVTAPGIHSSMTGLFGRSLVLVFSKEVSGKAGRHLYTDNLAEVLKFV